MRDWNSGKGLIIVNKSSYPLEYVCSGYDSGYPIEPVLTMFNPRSPHVIFPNDCGALLWSRHMGGNLGKWVSDFFTLGATTMIDQNHVCAYVSVKARTQGKDHIIAMGFTQGRNRCDKAGIQIRTEDGMLDGKKMVSANGVGPTGKVEDINTLATSVPFANSYEKREVMWHKFIEECKMLRVTCDQNSEWRGMVVFTIEDGTE